jgi:hypothetical protein
MKQRALAQRKIFYHIDQWQGSVRPIRFQLRERSLDLRSIERG